ncbi:acetyltransferase [Mucilaginibacter mali]|uniref:Acetyltransferase n=1 Tax=Mucilaginibacter mali TaxID=2740462 RepID=A0A7D4TTW2_9SPHI|nr:acetyltransferase [Mucilaginibacter mali]QKJ29395.1 acetyltransferase [Mucilaginibacter mali]
MEDIYILGSGGFAKEVYALVKSLNLYKVVAFVDIEERDDIRFNERSVPVISEDGLATISNKADNKVNLAIGVGDPLLITKLAHKFNDFVFPNLIHPSAIYDIHEVEFGRGNVITAGVIFTTCISVKDFNIFNLSATIGHDCQIGSYNVINPSVNLSGGLHIGNSNLFGVGSVILQHLNVGNNNTIGASALVTKNIDNDSIHIGVPAKKFLK